MSVLIYLLLAGVASAGVASSTKREQGLAYLKENAQDPEIITLPSGLQYKIISSAPPEGRTPTVRHRCLVNYNGTHINGKRFESSLTPKGQDAQPGPQVWSMWDKELIPGLKEALSLMKEGDHWNITLPAQLAFGERGSQSRKIQEGIVVVYELELIAIKEVGRFEFFGVDFADWQTHMFITYMVFYGFMIKSTIGNPFSRCYELVDAKSEDNPCVFFDVKIGDDEEPARIEIELFEKYCPKACENFRALCTGEKGVGKAGKPLHFKGTKFHRVVPGSMCQGGDITKGDGTGGESIYGETFPDEWWGGWIAHTDPFLVSMTNFGKNTNNSQFFITTSKQKQYDGKNVVVGRVFKGEEFITAIEALGAADGTLSKPVTIVNSGMVLRPKAPKTVEKKEEKKEEVEDAKLEVEDKKDQ
jgi:peptidylprolyl isomerase